VIKLKRYQVKIFSFVTRDDDRNYMNKIGESGCQLGEMAWNDS